MRRSARRRLDRTKGTTKGPIVVRKRTFRASGSSSSETCSRSNSTRTRPEAFALRDHHDVRVMIPGYREVLAHQADISVVARLPAASGLPACDLGRIEMADGLVVYIVLCPDLYDREGSPYGDTSGLDWADNDVRFARLGLAAAELANGLADLDWRPDLLHLNDWPSALAAAFLAWRSASTPTILTIHNLA